MNTLLPDYTLALLLMMPMALLALCVACSVLCGASATERE